MRTRQADRRIGGGSDSRNSEPSDCTGFRNVRRIQVTGSRCMNREVRSHAISILTIVPESVRLQRSMGPSNCLLNPKNEIVFRAAGDFKGPYYSPSMIPWESRSAVVRWGRYLEISARWPQRDRGLRNANKDSQLPVAMRHAKKEGWAVLAF